MNHVAMANAATLPYLTPSNLGESAAATAALQDDIETRNIGLTSPVPPRKQFAAPLVPSPSFRVEQIKRQTELSRTPSFQNARANHMRTTFNNRNSYY